MSHIGNLFQHNDMVIVFSYERLRTGQFIRRCLDHHEHGLPNTGTLCGYLPFSLYILYTCFGVWYSQQATIIINHIPQEKSIIEPTLTSGGSGRFPVFGLENGEFTFVKLWDG